MNHDLIKKKPSGAQYKRRKIEREAETKKKYTKYIAIFYEWYEYS